MAMGSNSGSLGANGLIESSLERCARARPEHQPGSRRFQQRGAQCRNSRITLILSISSISPGCSVLRLLRRPQRRFYGELSAVGIGQQSSRRTIGAVLLPSGEISATRLEFETDHQSRSCSASRLPRVPPWFGLMPVVRRPSLPFEATRRRRRGRRSRCHLHRRSRAHLRWARAAAARPYRRGAATR